MGDYGFEGAGDFGGTDYPNIVEPYPLPPMVVQVTSTVFDITPANLSFSTSFTVFPSDTNYNVPPSVFGGKVLAEMDNCAAMTCKRALYCTDLTDAITVNVNNVNFYIGAQIGDLVFLTGTIISFGNKSIDVKVVGMREDKKGKSQKICDGMFRFVARRNGMPAVHHLRMPY